MKWRKVFLNFGGEGAVLVVSASTTFGGVTVTIQTLLTEIQALSEELNKEPDLAQRT